MSDREQLEAFRRELSAVMPADFKDWHENDPAEWPMLAAQVIRDLRAERDELAADAERYRWLRNKPLDWSIEHHHDGWATNYGRGELDAAIDKARAKP